MAGLASGTVALGSGTVATLSPDPEGAPDPGCAPRQRSWPWGSWGTLGSPSLQCCPPAPSPLGPVAPQVLATKPMHVTGRDTGRRGQVASCHPNRLNWNCGRAGSVLAPCHSPQPWAHLTPPAPGSLCREHPPRADLLLLGVSSPPGRSLVILPLPSISFMASNGHSFISDFIGIVCFTQLGSAGGAGGGFGIDQEVPVLTTGPLTSLSVNRL